MNTFLSTEYIENHLKSNISNEDYQNYMNREMYGLDGLKLVLNMEKILKASSLINKIELNVVLAKTRLKMIQDRRKPSIGDFIKIGEQFYRIAIFTYDGNFQYTTDGSFYIDKEGYGSYSGGFNFEHGGTFNISQLSSLRIQTKEGNFWFFSNDFAGGGRGVHFKGDFNVWEIIK
jgi:hypothetical protein